METTEAASVRLMVASSIAAVSRQQQPSEGVRDCRSCESHSTTQHDTLPMHQHERQSLTPLQPPQPTGPQLPNHSRTHSAGHTAGHSHTAPRGHPSHPSPSPPVEGRDHSGVKVLVTLNSHGPLPANTAAYCATPQHSYRASPPNHHHVGHNQGEPRSRLAATVTSTQPAGI